jgi:hypothetical protein
MKPTLTHEKLVHVLHYDPETGIFTWMNPQSRRIRRGEPAGCLRDDGYLGIRIDGVRYQAHRLAIFYMTGVMPPDDADHRNRVRLDNKFGNLRKATRQQNTSNRSITSANTSGVVGVGWDKRRRKWEARIKVSGKTINLGRFVRKEDAIAARRAAEVKYFDEFAPRHWMSELHQPSQERI